jgi:hypothetical protein
MPVAESDAGKVFDAIERYLNSDAGDGLPVVPPTGPAVQAFVEASGLPQDTVIGTFAPRMAQATVRDLAINAVMAGCKAEYARVLVAAVRGLTSPAFDMFGIANSTKGSAPLLIVNGPVRQKIGVNCRGNVFGPSFRANATIGRAVRLMILNIGGAKPNVLDRGTLGHPGRFTYCIGEDEEDSPWEPLHVERDLSAEQSAVTVFGGESLRLVNMHHNSAEAVLYSVAHTLASTGIYNDDNIVGRMPHVIVFAKEHRDLLKDAGWSKQTIKEFIAENAVIPAEWMRQVGSQDASARVVDKPEDLLIVAAGGDAGRFAAVIAGWSHQSQPVTVAVE